MNQSKDRYLKISSSETHPSVKLVLASIECYPIIQNMGSFYVYEASRECGFPLPEDGLYKHKDYKNYFEEETRSAYLIQAQDEIAGFILLNQATIEKATNWNIGEFFVLAKFQRKGIGMQAAHKLWRQHPGRWEISIIPENKSAIQFWQCVLSMFVGDRFDMQLRTVSFDTENKNRLIFSFDTADELSSQPKDACVIASATTSDRDAMNALSYQKRRAYEKAHPQFWKWAGQSGENAQRKWFLDLLKDENYICLTAKHVDKLVGFIIGKITPAPEVYNPGGLTLVIDDFCVDNHQWNAIGDPPSSLRSSDKLSQKRLLKF